MKAKLGVLLTLLFASFGAIAAGEYTVSFFGDGKPADPAALISDIVTREYVTRFPAERYEIVLIYNCTQVSSGGDTVCTAVSGVSPKINAQGRTGGLVPLERFNTAAIQPKGATTRDIDALRDTVIRASVRSMMADLPAAPKPRPAPPRL